MKFYINGKKWARKELKITGLQLSGISSNTVLCWIWNARGEHILGQTRDKEKI